MGRDAVTVRLNCTYRCGHCSSREVRVVPPDPGEAVDEWWDRVVLPETGDGHSCGSTEHALYEAVVVAAPGRGALRGAAASWEG